MSRVLFHSEQATYNTVRVECVLARGGSSVGTGFFFQFARGPDKNIPVVVTNAHVINGSTSLKLRLRTRNSDGSPNNQDQVQFELPFSQSHWIRHPNQSVDLAVLPVAGVLEEMTRQNKPPFFVSLRKEDMPTAQQLDNLGAVEDVLMVGYPNGLWDETNNLPIARAGITATHPVVDYNGKPEFVIDAACFGGSSGSPVFYHNSGMTAQRGGGIAMGAPVFLLLGVLYAGPMYTAHGDIVVVDVPTQKTAIATSAIPMNLGYVIKSRCILDFDQLFPTNI